MVILSDSCTTSEPGLLKADPAKPILVTNKNTSLCLFTVDLPLRRGYVPLFVEHCEAVAAEIDVRRRWLGEQELRVSCCFGKLPEQHVTLEVAYEPSVVGSLWPLPASRPRSIASPSRQSAIASRFGRHAAPCPSHSRSCWYKQASAAAPSAVQAA